MSTSSCAAVATLTVPSSTLQKDVLLQLMTKIVPSHQVQVKVEKKGNATTLETLQGITLTQRNAILRCLCGIGLCNALDNNNRNQLLLLGGQSTTASMEGSLALASITSWMSVAADTTGSAVDLLQQLNSHLTTNAFLIPSSACTLSDLDLSLKLLSQKDLDMSGYPHVQRWLRQCHATCTKYAADSNDITIPPLPMPSQSPSLPQFFYPGDNPPMPAAAAAPKKADKPEQQQQINNKKQQQQQQQQSKKEKQKQQQPKQQQQQQQQADDVNISALDIRVGKITKVWNHEKADKLFCEEIDLGEDGGPRNIASGLRPFYKQEDLEGKMVIVLCNLKKRNLVGFPSHGMVLCASNSDHTDVKLVQPPAECTIGERVMFDSFDGEPEPENKVAKKKIFEKLAPDLKTSADGIVMWKEAQAKTSQGIISGCMPNAQVA